MQCLCVWSEPPAAFPPRGFNRMPSNCGRLFEGFLIHFVASAGLRRFSSVPRQCRAFRSGGPFLCSRSRRYNVAHELLSFACRRAQSGSERGAIHLVSRKVGPPPTESYSY